MKLRLPKYSEAELKDRRVKFRYRLHRRFAFMPVVVTHNDPISGRIGRRIYWFRFFDRQLQLGRWFHYPAKAGTRFLKQRVDSSEPAPKVNPHEP